MRFLLAFALAASTFALAASAFAADNELTPAEKKAGWKLLFDGHSFKNWSKPGDSWGIEDGVLTTKLKPKIQEDLISAKSYGDFELQFDWRVSEGANTGLKYRLQRTVSLNPAAPGQFEANIQHEIDNPSGAKGQVYTVAFEMQLIDDLRHPDAKKDENHVTGALYSMLPPVKHPAHPAGEWNHSKVVLKGQHFEHWINGELALKGTLDDPKGLENLKKRWAEGPAVYDLLAHAKLTGQITLQHHGDKVWFRNLKVRELKEGIWDF
jgi:hypothetical protein